MDFVSGQAATTDVFCFQEVFSNDVGKHSLQATYHENLFAEIAQRLPEHRSYFAPYEVGHSYEAPVNYDLAFGLATFVRRTAAVLDHGTVWVGTKQGATAFLDRNLQYVQLTIGQALVVIGNFHGLWLEGVGKADSPERIKQSQKIRKWLDSQGESVMLCGDFNLDPDTHSLRMLEHGFRNQITDFGITDTRTAYYPSAKPSRFADYVLTSPKINVTSFTVPDLPISDHRPMIVECQLS